MKLRQTGYRAVLMTALTLGAASFQASAEEDSAQLAKKLQNPIADLISVPMKLDWDTGIGTTDADRSTYVVQPVIPISLNQEWNVISRTIVPVYIDAQSPIAGGNDTSGMGDILQSFFISPKAPTASGWIWGAGPAFSLPTGDDGLTSDKFSVGPTAVVLKQEKGWTYGGLINHLWSISGNSSSAFVSSTFLQPFLSYTTRTYTSLGVNTESTYNWKANNWTVPVNLSVSQLLKLGRQPVSFLLGYRNYVQTPTGGPDWGIRFQVTLLFPK